MYRMPYRRLARGSLDTQSCYVKWKSNTVHREATESSSASLYSVKNVIVRNLDAQLILRSSGASYPHADHDSGRSSPTPSRCPDQ